MQASCLKLETNRRVYKTRALLSGSEDGSGQTHEHFTHMWKVTKVGFCRLFFFLANSVDRTCVSKTSRHNSAGGFGAGTCGMLGRKAIKSLPVSTWIADAPVSAGVRTVKDAHRHIREALEALAKSQRVQIRKKKRGAMGSHQLDCGTFWLMPKAW